jgi:hypothetical protein
MSRRKLTSTLDQIVEQVFTSKDLESAKKITLDFLAESKIKVEDRDKMISEITKMKDLVKLQIYCANALLKFEGLSVNQ